MVVKRRLVRRKPVEEEVEDEEVEDEDLEEEEEEEVEEEEEDEEEEEEVVVKKAPRGISRHADKKAQKPPKVEKPAPKKVKVEEPEEEEEEEEVIPAKKIKVQKVEETVIGSILVEAMKQLGDGKVVVISSLGHDKFSVGYSDAVAAVKEKIRGKQYWDIVASPGYKSWNHEWHQKTYDEKVKFAKSKKIKWDTHPNPKVDVIRLTEAVRAALGVEKYKPEYRSRSARANLRG